MLGVFNAAFDVGKLPESMNEAIIIALLKPGKDPVNPESYRLISLLTSDVKLLAKVLATRLIKHIDSLCSPRSIRVHPRQVYHHKYSAIIFEHSDSHKQSNNDGNSHFITRCG